MRRLLEAASRQYSTERTRPDGRFIEVRANPVPCGGVVIIYSDITDRKRAEAEIRTARDAAEEASRTKSSFLAKMSHELRTPLNAIIGLTEMLCDNAARFGTEKALEPLRRVLRAGRHLLGLINDILDLSKIEAGKMDLTLESVAIQPIVDEVSDVRGHSPSRTRTRSSSTVPTTSARFTPTTCGCARSCSTC